MSHVRIESTRADHPQVIALLDALDRYLGELYEPEANHILSIGELLAPDVRFFAAWQGDRGYTYRGAFGGYAANGLSVFMQKRLA
jgi:hypothetical protein